MSLEEIRTYTPWALAILSLIWTVALVVIKKTFATKKEVDELKNRQERLEVQIKDQPSHQEMSDLKLSIERLRGDIREVHPKIEALQNMSDLLIQNELKEKA